MAEQANTNSTYFRLLEKFSTGEAAAVVAAPNAPAQTSDRQTICAAAIANGPAEMRCSPRFKCDGNVELLEEKCDVRTWATFSDVSLHGCYIETRATYPVGTDLQMKMDLNGVHFESKGAVRVHYPYLGMGMAFIGMSQENQDRLEKLLGTATHSRFVVGPGLSSVIPTCKATDTPAVASPGSALQALVDFFQARPLLTREDFWRIVAKSRVGETRA